MSTQDKIALANKCLHAMSFGYEGKELTTTECIVKFFDIATSEKDKEIDRLRTVLEEVQRICHPDIPICNDIYKYAEEALTLNK